MSEEEVEAPPRSKRLKTDVKTDPKKLIIILEDCSLESGKVSREPKFFINIVESDLDLISQLLI